METTASTEEATTSETTEEKTSESTTTEEGVVSTGKPVTESVTDGKNNTNITPSPVVMFSTVGLAYESSDFMPFDMSSELVSSESQSLMSRLFIQPEMTMSQPFSRDVVGSSISASEFEITQSLAITSEISSFTEATDRASVATSSTMPPVVTTSGITSTNSVLPALSETPAPSIFVSVLSPTPLKISSSVATSLIGVTAGQSSVARSINPSITTALSTRLVTPAISPSPFVATGDTGPGLVGFSPTTPTPDGGIYFGCHTCGNAGIREYGTARGGVELRQF